MADDDLLKRLFDAGMTFTAMTQARAEELIRELVRSGAVQAEQAQASIDELVERGRRNSERVIEAVRTEVNAQLANLDLATRDDLERLVREFADMAAETLRRVTPDRFTGAAAGGAAATAPAAVVARRASTAKRTGTAKKAGGRSGPAG